MNYRYSWNGLHFQSLVTSFFTLLVKYVAFICNLYFRLQCDLDPVGNELWIANTYNDTYIWHHVWMLIAFEPVCRLCVLVAVSASINSDSLLVIWGAERKEKNNGAKIMIFMNGDKNSCVTPTNIVIIYQKIR